MKYDELVKVEPLLVRPETAALIVGSNELLKSFVKAGWLEPVLKRNRLTVYAVKDLAKCVERLQGGEQLGGV